MIFNSLEFILFLPCVFLIYWLLLRRSLTLQNIFIVIVSYVFYGSWNWRFLLLIAFTTVCSYLSGVFIEKYNENRKIQKAISAGSIVVNLFILGLFKYYNFFADSFAALFKQFGVALDWVTLDILLPVGISFYTFQALSYSIDVYTKKIKPTHDVVSFFAYVSFFPQLVAGPIEKATHLLPQFYKPRLFSYQRAVDGSRQILWGLFKKIVIADNCAYYTNQIFENYTDYDGSTLLLGGIYFAFQIYGDFSGYSDIAIGTSKLFGIDLKRNFDYPYFSRDIGEFWRRWHISLNTWFRDYIYIPLGGSRVSKSKVVRNTLIIFLVSGLWHGANWTFVTWGLYHSLLFIPLILLGTTKKSTDIVAVNSTLPTIKEFVGMVTTFILVVIGWVIFRADNITQAYGYLDGICSTSLLSIPQVLSYKTIAFVISSIILEWIARKYEHPLQIVSDLKYRSLRWSVYLILIIIMIEFGGNPETFVYFQF